MKTILINGLLILRPEREEFNMMDCFRCKGTTAEKLKTHTVTLEDCVIIVKNVPALFCKQCGEAYFSDEVMQNLEAIIDKVERLVKEVAIVEYSSIAA